MLTKEYLQNEYINQEKSMGQIAKENNVAIGTVYNYIKKYNITSRHHLTDKAKAQISSKNKGRPSKLKGKKLSNEMRLKISIAKKGKFRKPTQYGGHIKKRCDGYRAVYNPTHKRANKDGYIMEHDLIMEQKIGRALKPNKVVHHINKIKDDNRLENLQLMTTSEHARLHMLERHRNKKEADDLSIK